MPPFRRGSPLCEEAARADRAGSRERRIRHLPFRTALQGMTTPLRLRPPAGPRLARTAGWFDLHADDLRRRRFGNRTDSARKRFGPSEPSGLFGFLIPHIRSGQGFAGGRSRADGPSFQLHLSEFVYPDGASVRPSPGGPVADALSCRGRGRSEIAQSDHGPLILLIQINSPRQCFRNVLHTTNNNDPH